MPARDPLSDEQIVSMLKSKAFGTGCRLRNQAMFLAQLAFGVRIAELLRLLRGEVLDRNGELRERVTFTKTKNGRSRTVDFVHRLGREYMLRWLQYSERFGYMLDINHVFPGRVMGKSLSSRQFNNVLYAAAAEIGFTGWCSSHSCRKTWAIGTYQHYLKRYRMGENIDPLLQLKEAGGWETMDAASKYIRSMLVDWRESQASLYPGLETAMGETDFEEENEKNKTSENCKSGNREYFSVKDYA